ncbi:MAG: hypothetical protein C0605_10285 [Hyphomicrobiales bacterium]|nr:MAG: hypothetical protein C0605_10285 [Hyphomicrobiales bacterium]
MAQLSEEILFSNDASDFVTSINEATSVDQALGQARQALQPIGIDRICLTVDPGSPSQFVAHDLPDWVPARFLEEIIPSEIDPMVGYCRRNRQPLFCGKAFYKSRGAPSAALDIWLDVLSQQGLSAGLTIPVHSRHGGDWGMIHLGADMKATEFRKIISAHGNNAILISAYAYYHIRQIHQDTGRGKLMLTPREKECLSWISKGERNDGIAHRLNVTRPTVDFHISNARRKLAARTREQAVAIAVREGLINP